LRTDTTGTLAGLTAAGRVERRAVEGHLVVTQLGDGGVELAQVGVAQVQEIGHHP
jgi:hypothetical protein